MPAGFTDLASGLGSEAPRKKKTGIRVALGYPSLHAHALTLEWCGVALRRDVTTVHGFVLPLLR